MVVIGISALDCESAVSVLVDGEVVWAASEERFTRNKQQDGFPVHALEAGMAAVGLRPSDVDAVTFPFLGWRSELAEKLKNVGLSLRDELRHQSPAASRAHHQFRMLRSAANYGLRLGPRWDRLLMNGLREAGLDSKVRFMKHHPTHAASAYFLSGWDRALAVIVDGYGSGECTTVFACEGGKIRQLLSVRSPHSLGVMYGIVTRALGFRPNRHEGKILGLAAYGNPEPVRSELLAGFEQWPGGYAMKSALALYRDTDRRAERYAREDVSAGYQTVLEEVGAELVRHYVKRTGIDRIVLAGGVAANVKLNQRIAEIDGVREVFVFPAMADPGTGYGGALAHYAERHGLKPRRLPHVYLGPEFSEKEMATALEDGGLSVRPYPDAEDRVARLLAQGHVVARFDGRMEFGPRALGNRSILSQATDPDINDTLNKRLKRTEFMPFAPITLPEHADECYENMESGRYAAEFMTITVDCTTQMKEQSPAAVHVDGTARPQLVNPDVNPTMYRILRRYHELTGIPSVINTSFNIHEEPIVCTPRDAVRGFLDGNLEFLSMGSFLAQHPDVPKAKAALDDLDRATAAAK